MINKKIQNLYNNISYKLTMKDPLYLIICSIILFLIIFLLLNYIVIPLIFNINYNDIFITNYIVNIIPFTKQPLIENYGDREFTPENVVVDKEELERQKKITEKRNEELEEKINEDLEEKINEDLERQEQLEKERITQENERQKLIQDENDKKKMPSIPTNSIIQSYNKMGKYSSQQKPNLNMLSQNEEKYYENTILSEDNEDKEKVTPGYITDQQQNMEQANMEEKEEECNNVNNKDNDLSNIVTEVREKEKQEEEATKKESKQLTEDLKKIDVTNFSVAKAGKVGVGLIGLIANSIISMGGSLKSIKNSSQNIATSISDYVSDTINSKHKGQLTSNLVQLYNKYRCIHSDEYLKFKDTTEEERVNIEELECNSIPEYPEVGCTRDQGGKIIKCDDNCNIDNKECKPRVQLKTSVYKKYIRTVDYSDDEDFEDYCGLTVDNTAVCDRKFMKWLKNDKKAKKMMILV